MTRPSDRAIAQAFAEFQEATIAVPVGHYDDTKGSSTYNWRRSFESAVLERARELDATAAPVVVGDDRNVASVRAKLLDRSNVGLAKYGVTTERGDLSQADWLRHLQEELMDAAVYIEASLTAALAGD